jgi:hypothetical protein
MVDFHSPARKIHSADSEDRALLGSNPSTAVGDGNNSRSGGPKPAPAPITLLIVVLVRKAINPFRFEVGKTRLLNPTGVPYGNIYGTGEPWLEKSCQENKKLIVCFTDF